MLNFAILLSQISKINGWKNFYFLQFVSEKRHTLLLETVNRKRKYFLTLNTPLNSTVTKFVQYLDVWFQRWPPMT